MGLDFGVTEEDIHALITDTEGKPNSLDPLSKQVLKAAREMTKGGAMTDATFAMLQSELGNELVVDLTLAIGFYNAVVRVLATLQIDVEPDYMVHLKKFPLPA